MDKPTDYFKSILAQGDVKPIELNRVRVMNGDAMFILYKFESLKIRDYVAYVLEIVSVSDYVNSSQQIFISQANLAGLTNMFEDASMGEAEKT